MDGVVPQITYDMFDKSIDKYAGQWPILQEHLNGLM